MDPALPTSIKYIRQYKAKKVIYDVEMTTASASQEIRDAFGLFWRKKSGKRLPPDLKGISFSNATSFPTRVRLRLLKDLCRRHQQANPNLSCYVTSYLAGPELKIRDRRGLVTSLTYTQAIQQLSQHLTLGFLQDLYQYAKTNLPEKEVLERFLILTPDLLLGQAPDQLSMSVDDPPVAPPQPPPASFNPPSVPATIPQAAVPAPTATSAGLTNNVQIQSQNAIAVTDPDLHGAVVTYASLAALPPSTSGASYTFFQHPPPPLSSTPAHTQTTSSPTYAILTPVQISPTDHLSGSFLTSAQGSGFEVTSNDDSLHKRNRQSAKISLPLVV